MPEQVEDRRNAADEIRLVGARALDWRHRGAGRSGGWYGGDRAPAADRVGDAARGADQPARASDKAARGVRAE